MKKYLGLILLVFLISCKSKSVIAEAKATDALSSEKIITNHYNNNRDFKTLYIKASARYKDDKQSQSVTAEIKILKDEKILVSIRFLGITMAKALITPKEVKYYEKINSNYFEGDYTTLSKWLGTDLDFQKVQNMLIGQAMDDLKKGKYKTQIENTLYKLDTKASGTEKAFYFEAANFLIKRQEIEQPAKNRMLHVSYPAHKEHSQMILPAELVIEAFSKEKKSTINIEYNTVTFNEELSFPYSTPEGYDKIEIE